MSEFLRFFFGIAVWLFILGVALWRGQGPERTVSAAHLIGMFATPLAQAHVATNDPDIGIMTVDLLVFVVLTWVALRSDRWWPLFSSAFFLITIGIHIIKITRPDASQYVYATSQIFFNYMSLYALGAGVIALEIRRSRARRAGLGAA